MTSPSFTTFIQVLWRSYTTQLFSLLMLLCSLIVASAGLSAVLVINQSAKQSYSSSQQYFVPNVNYQIVPTSSIAGISKADYARLRLAGFTQLIAMGQFRSHVYSGDKRISQRAIDFTGVDTTALLSLPAFLADSGGASAQTGNTPASKTPQAEYDDDVANSFVNNTFALSSNNQMQGFLHPRLYQQILASNMSLSKDAQPKGNSADDALNVSVDTKLKTLQGEYLPKLQVLDAAFLGNDIVMDMSTFYTYFTQANISQILVVGQLSSIQNQQLTQALPSYLKLVALDNAQQGELTQSFHLNLLAMALLMFVVCLFIVLNASQLLINKRMPWLKVCRQVGIARKTMLFAQLIEISVLGALSCVLGVFLGVQLALLVSPAVHATLEGLYGVEVGFGNTNYLSLFVKVYAVTLLGSTSAFLIPLRQMNQKLAFKNIIDANWQTPFKQTIVFMLLSIVLSFVAFSAFYLSQSLSILLAATACLILAGCALLIALYPYLLTWVSTLIPTRFSLLRVSVSQSRALSNKTKIACCAFFIASTSNIGMNLMVDSFRGATQDWLSQRLVADHYLYFQSEQDLLAILANNPDTASIDIVPRYEHQIQFNNTNVQTYSYPATGAYIPALAFSESIDRLTMPDTTGASTQQMWAQYAALDGVFINQQFSIRHQLGVGDMIEIQDQTLSLTGAKVILGIYYDYGNPSAQLLLPLSAFTDLPSSNGSSVDFPSNIFAINGLQESSASFQALVDVLAELEVDASKQLLRTQDLLALSMQTFDRTFIITDGLNLVTLLVAALSLACAIVVLMDDIRPQQMLIRSFGVSTFKSQLLAYFQYLLLCLVALVMATPFGILLSWVLIFEINYQAFQWTYPLVIDWSKIVNIYGLSIAVVTAIIAVPIINSGRKPLIDDIRYLN